MREHDTNEASFAVHLRAIPDQIDGHDLPQRHYTAQQLNVTDDCEGGTRRLAPDQAQALMRALLNYYDTTLPPPPRGLPGALDVAFEPGVMRLLQMGCDYLRAVAERRPRIQIGIHAEMLAALRRAYDQGRSDEHEAVLRRVEEERERQAKGQVNAAGKERVYFIASESGPVKIGMAKDPLLRLKTLQTGHHEKLAILATCAGGRDQEWEYHQRFKDHRLNGEWFKRVPEIEAEIGQLVNCTKPSPVIMAGGAL